MPLRLGFAVGFALALLPWRAADAQTAPRAVDPPQTIQITAQTIDSFDSRDPGRTKFGALTFRGGLVLTSPHREFGGLSAIRLNADGKSLIAVSDRGQWLRGRIEYRGDKPVGIVDAEMAPMLGPDGNPLRRRGWYDAESLAQSGGTLFVGIERVHQILRFDYGRNGLTARGQPMALPPAMKRLTYNAGIECLVPMSGPRAGGALIAITERSLDPAGNILGFVVGGAKPGSFAVRRTDEFDVSDCAATPKDGLVILERRFSWTRGLAIRMRRLAMADVQTGGGALDGPEIFFADMGQQVDNMEGLSIHRSPDGQLILTMISDDNFSAIQRTLLLQFAWTE